MIKHFFLTDPPKEIFLDTCFLVNALYDYPDGVSFQDRKNHRENKVASEFLKLLISEAQRICVSSMIFPEFWKAILINEIAEHEALSSTKDKVEEAEKCLARNPLLISKHFGEIEEATKKLAILFESSGGKIKVCESSPKVNEKAMRAMKDFCLHSYDAIHIGSMISHGISDFATGDDHIISNCSKKINIWTYPSYQHLDMILNKIKSARQKTS